MDEDRRPDAQALLREVQREEKGRLKVFFGYAAGVGKTYAMLEAAHRAKAAGVDVAVGYIEPHTRPATMALLEGLERLPVREIAYKGITLRELDLDGALARRPQVLLVDELAHTNAEGCRHMKRYQDVEELLRAGISVLTTVNVQHLESLNDVVASITGVAVSERIPDHIFDAAEQVELVDIEPADLMERLQSGKVYQERQAKLALEHFFSEKNLAALREISMRRTADRLGRAPVAPTEERSKSGEHILICLSGAPSNAKVIRTAARMAEAFHSEFTALHVETPSFEDEDEQSRRRFQANLRLAEELGARIATVYGDDAAVQIVEYARTGGVSKIVLGRSYQKRRLLAGNKSLMDRLSVLAPDLDVYIIPDRQNQQTHREKHKFDRVDIGQFSALDAGKMLGILALCTLVGMFFVEINFTMSNVIMVYILGVLWVSMVTGGRIYSLLASLFSVLIFNFFFTYPYFSLAANDPSWLATFGVMFFVALLSSSLTTRIKRQAVQSARKAYRTEVLLETSQKLQKAEGEEAILALTATQLNKLLDRAVVFYGMAEHGGLGEAVPYSLSPEEDISPYLVPGERAVAEWVWKNNKHAGATTGTLPAARCLYMAVRGADRPLAVAGIVIGGGGKPDAYDKNLMVALLDECGLALGQGLMEREKREMEATAKQEALRANLLRAISHDLRTPLTSISGNAGILMEKSLALDEEKKRGLYASIYDDAMWLVNLVENLLSVTRLENGAMKIKLQPELLEEVFQEAVDHLDRRAQEHKIAILPDDLLMADMEARLIVQVVINMVNNAIKYTPAGSKITLSAVRKGTQIEVRIDDDGPGIPNKAREKLFDMFYTADNARGDGRRGLGLGLSLCKSIVNAHGGTIWAEKHLPNGSRFCFTLHASEVNTCE